MAEISMADLPHVKITSSAKGFLSHLEVDSMELRGVTDLLLHIEANDLPPELELRLSARGVELDGVARVIVTSESAPQLDFELHRWADDGGPAHDVDVAVAA